MAKKKLKFNPNTEYSSHFFASSCSTWKVSTDPKEVIDYMISEGRPFNLYYVPEDISVNYEIKYFAPVVDDVVLIGSYNVKE